MIPLKQIIDEVNAVYIFNTDVAELGSALVRLDGVLDNPSLNATNRENAEALYDRLAAKFELIKFVMSPSQGLREKLREDFALLKGDAEKKGFKKTTIMLEEAYKIFLQIESDIDEVLIFGQRLHNGDNNDPEVLRLTSEAIRTATAKVEKEQFCTSFTGGAVMIDAKKEILRYLNVLKERVESELRAVLYAKLKDCVEDITSQYALYEFYPSAECDEGGRANTIILSSPFIEDVKLYALNNRKDPKNKLFLISSDKLKAEILGVLFDYLKNEGADIVVANLPDEEIELQKSVLKYCIEYGNGGASVVVNDSIGDGTLYSIALKVVTENGFNMIDVSSEFMSVPPFNAVVEELIDREMLRREDSAILKNMPFLGFMGLNRIVKEYVIKNGNWIDQGKRISRRNQESAIKFLRYIKAPYMFIDSGWGDYSEFEEQQTDDHYEFDYDGIRNVNIENIRRIVEFNCPLFAKCGMAARYCTIAGDDKSIWASLTREEMLQRLDTATKVVFKLLRVEIVPEVKLLDDLSNPTAGGLCVGGGKEIHYRYRDSKSLDWLWDTIVHESFHAVQHQLMDGDWKRWYYDELGITKGRVKAWKATSGIYNHDTNSDMYKVHIFERDAKAFETDCAEGRNYYWSSIEFI